MAVTPVTKTALKEWAVAVAALTEGEMILLLRKGGIREPEFAVFQPQFWLYPTYEHQKPQLLKAKYAKVEAVASGWHPETVTIPAWATVTHSFQISEAAVVEELSPFHIWNEAFVTERLKWKPRLPLSVLLLRVYRLLQPQVIPYRAEYGGCKSWTELQETLTSEAVPVLSETAYLQQVEDIANVVTSAIPLHSL